MIKAAERRHIYSRVAASETLEAPEERHILPIIEKCPVLNLVKYKYSFVNRIYCGIIKHVKLLVILKMVVSIYLCKNE